MAGPVMNERELWHIFKMLFFPCGSMRWLFSNIYCENLVKLLEGNLTKLGDRRWGDYEWIVLGVFFNLILFLNLKHCISFAKHQNKTSWELLTFRIVYSETQQFANKLQYKFSTQVLAPRVIFFHESLLREAYAFTVVFSLSYQSWG